VTGCQCGHSAERHDTDDEERRECLECDCRQYCDAAKDHEELKEKLERNRRERETAAANDPITVYGDYVAMGGDPNWDDPDYGPF
jgi:hypothetical protein